MLACDVRLMIVPCSSIVVVVRGSRMRPDPEMGPTSWPWNAAMNDTVPRSMPRFEGEGMVDCVSRRIEVPESPGKLGLTIATPGRPLNAVNEMSLESWTSLKIVPSAETRTVGVVI